MSFCYCSKQDRAVGFWAKLSQRLGGWAGLGYGTLAYDGPQNLYDPDEEDGFDFRDRVTLIKRDFRPL